MVSDAACKRMTKRRLAAVGKLPSTDSREEVKAQIVGRGSGCKDAILRDDRLYVYGCGGPIRDPYPFQASSR